MLPTLNGTARLIEDPELRYAASGGAVARVRLAFNSRKKDQAGQWVDDASFFVTGTAFGQAAENIAATLQRGMEVVVSGRMKTDSWEKDGEKQSRPALLLDSVGPSLRFATARVEKSGGSGSGRQEFQQARQQQGAGSGGPWASAPAGGGGGWAGGGEDEPPF
ncbi:single-stranded DNA-binding protein [Streptomyces sp. ME19-01-6]|uniref:single-stranded DNA-binding protein n=1 Tax=Streptomyces sp. ME19-01-6 TaxID=3028686 RepID=UPI0029ABA71D|nr:single-stranded DNA-binding protein [Streptomyces sp. ME19-01-6]MDX3232948.1 single-stranded DNA-binding protein [Streptomyces sp. ME19-01-6]